VLIEPARVLGIIGAMFQPWAHKRALGVTLVFGVILALGYVTVRTLLVHPERS
jgi:hypothetical protein